MRFTGRIVFCNQDGEKVTKNPREYGAVLLYGLAATQEKNPVFDHGDWEMWECEIDIQPTRKFKGGHEEQSIYGVLRSFGPDTWTESQPVDDYKNSVMRLVDIDQQLGLGNFK